MKTHYDKQTLDKFPKYHKRGTRAEIKLQHYLWLTQKLGILFVAVQSFLKVTSATKQPLLELCHLKQRLRIFLFRRKIMFRSQDIQVFIFLTIQWFTKSVTSQWVIAHETRCIFECIFWTTTHKVTKLGQLIDISKGNNFLQSFEQFGRPGLDFRPFLI